ncbi:MAG TPA: tetratricopeptide repeat protein [Tepidisphaeraceae bacterium]|jgi:predicted O-linked N-acetylglucosamine transferase (SPINDLY family)
MDLTLLQSQFELAIGHQRANQHAEAAGVYRGIVAAWPGHGDAWNNLGIAMKMMGDLDGAIAAFGRAIELLPGRGEVYAYLGHALRDCGQLDGAIEAYRRGLAVSPDPRTADSMLMAMHAHPAFGRKELFEEHRDWEQQFARGIAHLGGGFPAERLGTHPFRIGYVAADLGNHPLGRMLLPLLENHDQSQFESYCYNDRARPDEIAGRLRRAVGTWRETGNLSHGELARVIRSDGIDILVDLTMHGPGSRLLAFAERPAPVQTTYLAYASTTGLSAIDYRLTDPYLDPVGIDESLYFERSVRLSRTYWCYPEPSEAPDVSAAPAVANGYLTFGCLNSFSKTNPQMMSVWAEVLGRVRDSRMLIHAQHGSHRARTRDLFAQHGIDPNRIEFVDFAPLHQYFANYNKIDVGLDTYPWAGGATTCDALWMGVPVVSLAGETAVSRGGLSILSNLGLSDLAAHSPEEFVRIATTLNLERIISLRSGLRGRMRASPVMNAAAFARDVEMAFRRMWSEKMGRSASS